MIVNFGIYELLVGYVGFVVGVEYCKEKSEIEELDNVVGMFFNVLGEDKGEYDVFEVFIEVMVLFFEGLLGVDMLIFDIVVCIVNYFFIGNVKSWKFGLDW